MKLIRIVFPLLCLMLISFTIDAQHCSKLPDQFDSSVDAISQVKVAEFEYTDRFNVYSSSWLEKAEFYSCDGENGFLIFHTLEEKIGIHANVPKILWKGFKKADAQSTYYNDYIKDRYPLEDSSK